MISGTIQTHRKAILKTSGPRCQGSHSTQSGGSRYVTLQPRQRVPRSRRFCALPQRDVTLLHGPNKAGFLANTHELLHSIRIVETIDCAVLLKGTNEAIFQNVLDLHVEHPWVVKGQNALVALRGCNRKTRPPLTRVRNSSYASSAASGDAIFNRAMSIFTTIALFCGERLKAIPSTIPATTFSTTSGRSRR